MREILKLLDAGGGKRFWCPVFFLCGVHCSLLRNLLLKVDVLLMVMSTQRIKSKIRQIIHCRGDTTSTTNMETPTKQKCGNNFRFSRSECSCGGHDRSNRRSQVYLPSVWKNV